MLKIEKYKKEIEIGAHFAGIKSVKHTNLSFHWLLTRTDGQK